LIIRCHICDTDADLPYDPITQTFEPCSACQEVVDEALAEFEDEEEPE
jgi:hypothetical protein